MTNNFKLYCKRWSISSMNHCISRGMAILIACGFFQVSIAQEEYKTPLPTIVPMSPNVAALAQYVDYPVSHYTGVPSINIPLYEADIYGYKLPISLSYHASGIRVSQEASWVGLGWSLNVAGAVSRSIKGTDDLYSTYRNGCTIEGYYKDPEIAGKNIMPPVEPIFENEFYNCRSAGVRLKVDPEPDIFYYSFPGASGKFLIDKSRGPVFFDKKDNVEIKLKNSRTPPQINYYFEIKTSDGTTYILDKEERTVPYSSPNHLNKNYTIAGVWDRSNLGLEDEFISAWYLSKIILPNKKEILFTYAAERIISPAQESLKLYYNIDGTFRTIYKGDCIFGMGERYNTAKTDCFTHRLSKIEWDGGCIEFTPCNRYDIIDNAKALSNIKVYNKSNTLVRQFNFVYSYFNDNIQNPPYDKEYICERLKLEQVNENELKGYRFSYFEGKMPPKNSKNVDYWGYQNGSFYGASYCAKQYVVEPTIGVNKNSNLNYLKIGTLQKITLPTGGDVTYVYEENDYSGGDFALNTSGKGGGLRVKEIITEGKTRRFSYSGGKLLAPPALWSYGIACPLGSRIRGEDCFILFSESKLPCSSFNNGNTVGYDQVEEYVTDGTNTSKTRYEFYNDPEEQIYDNVIHEFPRFTNYYNGLPKVVTLYNNQAVVEMIEYKYQAVFARRVEAFRWDNNYFSAFNYHYQPQYIQKTQEIVHRPVSSQNLEWVATKQFTYKDTCLLASSSLILDSSTNDSQKQMLYYPSNFTDAVSKAMVSAHVIGTPVEQISLRNDMVVMGKKTQFKQVNGMFLPEIVYLLDTETPRSLSNYSTYYNAKLYFDSYNSYGKPLQVRDNGMCIVYLWGYNGMYPIAEIKNATYAAVESAMGGKTNIEALESRVIPTADEWAKIIALRSNTSLSNASITLYKYDPLVGVTEINDPRNISTYYSYDSYSRLDGTKFDNNGTRTWLEKYFYNYK